MIRKNPTKIERIKEVKKELADAGINFFYNREWGTFQIWPKGDKRGGGSTYDTIGTSNEDLEDALRTGLTEAKRLEKRKNPRCRTFRVKRRVGKRTIQVRRKVCRRNPINDLSHLINKYVIIYEDMEGPGARPSLTGMLKGVLKLNYPHNNEYRLYDKKEEITIIFNIKDVENIKNNSIFLRDL